VGDGVTGVLVPAGDAAALRAALDRLLADNELRRGLGAVARRPPQERFSWAAVTDATLAAYSDATGTMVA
jgi:glycosyltransferase involved in cell wall biosynthesis